MSPRTPHHRQQVARASRLPGQNTDFTTPVTLKPDDGGVVHVMANDAMKYNTNRIEVSGQSVKIELKHVGKCRLNRWATTWWC